MGRRNGLRRPNSGKIYCKAGRADCGNDFSNMLQASPLIVYKYMLNVNIRVDLSEKLCYPYYSVHSVHSNAFRDTEIMQLFRAVSGFL